jgi:hypothetical protein
MLTPNSMSDFRNFRLLALSLDIALSLANSRATQPISALGTCVHEVGHAVAVILTGGRLLEGAVHLKADSYVRSIGGNETLILIAGYTSVLFWVSLVLILLRSPQSRVILPLVWALPFLLASTLMATPPGTLLLGVGLALGLAGARSAPVARFACELATLCIYASTVRHILLDPYSDNRADAAQLAEITQLPLLLFSVIWLLLALLPIVLGYSKASTQPFSSSLNAGSSTRIGDPPA